MRPHRSLFALLALAVVVDSAPLRRKDGNPLSRSMRVRNESGVKLDIFWIHPTTRELAASHTSGDGIVFGAESGILSYVGHEFEVREMPNKHGKCHDTECRKTYFACNDNEDQCE